MDDKEILLDGQIEFRQNRGVMNNVCILNCLAEKGVTGKERKMYSFFMDLNAVFNTLDREK